MDDGMVQLRKRRDRRTRLLRRRRRFGLLAALAVGVGLVVAATAVLASSPPPQTRVRATSSGGKGQRLVRLGSQRGAQLAAVKRLAVYGLPLFCGGRSRRMVALTFDDGPGPYTKLAVRKLRQVHVQATFFLVGKQILVHPGLAQLERLVAAAGDHTMTHPFLPGLSHAAMVQEIVGARRLIERTTGRPVVLFRPPYEAMSPAIDHEVRSLGMVEVLWNVDSADSLGANYAGIEHNVLAGLHPGSIILMHENHGQTIRALPTIFAALKHDRLRAVTVPQLIAQDPPSPAQLRAGEAGCSVSHHPHNGNGN